MMAKHIGKVTTSRAFLSGLARIFDPFSNLDSSPYSGPRKKTDTEMLRSDWIAIGQDMQNAMDSFGQKEKENAVR